MFSRHKRMIGILYLLADAALGLASFALAYWVRVRFVTRQPFFPDSNYLWIVPYAIALWLAITRALLTAHFLSDVFIGSGIG